MSVSFVLFMSAITVAAFLFFITRLMKVKYVIKFALLIDVVFSVLMLCGSGGTATGLAVAITAGLMLSITLWVAKRLTNAVAKARA